MAIEENPTSPMEPIEERTDAYPAVGVATETQQVETETDQVEQVEQPTSEVPVEVAYGDEESTGLQPTQNPTEEINPAIIAHADHLSEQEARDLKASYFDSEHLYVSDTSSLDVSGANSFGTDVLDDTQYPKGDRDFITSAEPETMTYEQRRERDFAMASNAAAIDLTDEPPFPPQESHFSEPLPAEYQVTYENPERKQQKELAASVKDQLRDLAQDREKLQREADEQHQDLVYSYDIKGANPNIVMKFIIVEEQPFGGVDTFSVGVYQDDHGSINHKADVKIEFDFNEYPPIEIIGYNIQSEVSPTRRAELLQDNLDYFLMTLENFQHIY